MPNAPAWFESDEVPRVGTDTTSRLIRRQRWIRVFVWACVILMPIAALSTIAAVAHRAKSTASTGQASLDPVGRAPAEVALSQWLASSPPPVPGASILSWNGQTILPAYHPPRQAGAQTLDTAAPTFTAVVEHFTVLGQNGAWYSAGVEVALNGSGGAVVLGTPSLEADPPPPSGSWASGTPWPGISASSSAPAPVVQAVSGWAQAYGSGSPQTLTLAVGDTNPSDYFTPLSGVSSITATVANYAPLGPASANEAVAEVNLSIVWNGETPPAPGSAQAPTVTMDLLIERASSAAPVVVAWGPPGSGPTLRPYQNAFRGYSSSSPPPTTPTTTSVPPGASS